MSILFRVACWRAPGGGQLTLRVLEWISSYLCCDRLCFIILSQLANAEGAVELFQLGKGVSHLFMLQNITFTM